MLVTVGLVAFAALVGVVGLYAVALRQLGWLRDDWPG